MMRARTSTMKTASIAILAIVMSAMIAPSLQAQRRKPIPEATPIEVPIPKGAVHILVKKGELGQVFTFFPYPPTPIDVRNRILPLYRTGVYRIEVKPDGSVAAVTILKSMGRSLDFATMKTLVRWRANAGPLRVVDVKFALDVWGRSGGGWLR